MWRIGYPKYICCKEMRSITTNGKESLFSSKGIMTSLHNLKIPLETFHLQEGQKEEILEHLKQCKSCHTWKYKHELINSKCGACGEIEPEPVILVKVVREVATRKDLSELPMHLQITFLTLERICEKGIGVCDAVIQSSISQKHYNDLPKKWKNLLKSISKTNRTGGIVQKNQRRTFTVKFKLDVLEEVKNSDLTQVEIAEKHGIHQAMISMWKKWARETNRIY